MPPQDDALFQFTARLTSHEMRLQDLEKNVAVADVHHKNVEKRLASIENSLTWLVRLVLGALILAAMTFAISGGFNV